ncbi:diguanylate cyclase [Thiomicrorhabdus sp. 6S2-11]|uniref:diguanylate cyclase n=1 Tax=Thiomicrorhabdus marina TaxID=2818442 RepID=A0ABS3Q423_9GAMM|nr:diguanylate cyclase [Thiomicrorhabdus marina]MBO1926575.1 diguanylate cyclase [Thiomicrorhabdus marina]
MSTIFSYKYFSLLVDICKLDDRHIPRPLRKPLSLYLLAFIFSIVTCHISAAEAEVQESLQPVTIQLNWNHQFQFAGYYAAIHQGYYRQAGIKVTLKPWENGINPLQEVLSGKADFGVGVSSIINDFAKGADIRLVLSAFQYSPLVLLSHRPIDDLNELAHKTIMHNGSIQIRSLLAKSGLQPEKMPTELPSSGNLNDFINDNVDFYGAYISNEPYQLDKLGVNYNIIDPKNFGVQNYSGLLFTSAYLATSDPELVSAVRAATIKGWQYAVNHPQELIDFISEHYALNKNPAFLHNEASTLKKYILQGNTPIGDIDPIKIAAILSEAKQLNLITSQEYQSVADRELVFNDSYAMFTAEERDFLQHHKLIITTDQIDYPPFQFQSNGIPQGLVEDYLRAIEKIIGSKFIHQSALTASQKAQLPENFPILYPAMSPHIGNQNQYLFSKKYLNFNLVLMGISTNSGFIQDLTLLDGYTLAVRKNSFPYQYLQTNYPNIKLLAVDTINDGLIQVKLNNAMAIIDNLPALNYTINNYGYPNFQVIGQIATDYSFAMATDINQPLLHSIIDKALQKIEPSQRSQIFQSWLSQKPQVTFNYQRFWQLLTVLIILVAFMLTLLIFNYRKQRYLKQIYELSYANMIDANSMKITWTSNAFSKLCGYSPKELIGFPYLKLAAPSIDSKQIHKIYQQVIENGHTWSGELAAVRKNGEEYWVELTLTPNKNFFGKVTNVLATRIDISDRKKVEEISITDELTGLYNRRYFDQRLSNELKRALREQQGLCFVMIDLDYFKKINDDYGHQIGDEVLIEIATSINTYFNRANDFVFRIGGEEFFVITHFEKLRAFAVHLNNLQESVRLQKIENKNTPLGYLTLSIGALFCSPECIPKESQVLHYTDSLLYQSKENGRNRMTVKAIDISAQNAENKPPREASCCQRDYDSFEDLIEDVYS